MFLSDAFLSIVDKDGDGTILLVRARKSGDIERMFPEAEVTKEGGTDYLYRARLPRDRLAEILSAKVRAIDYSNFKVTVHDDDRHRAYMKAWDAMRSMQGE